MTLIAEKRCQCRKPGDHPSPNRKGQCVRCALPFDPKWVSSDDTFNEFFARLRESLPVVGPEFDSFLLQCKKRELAGRDTFGFEYLARDNVVEAYEEAADGCLYAYLDVLKTVREDGDDADIGFALTAAAAFFQAYSALVQLHHKRHGAP